MRVRALINPFDTYHNPKRLYISNVRLQTRNSKSPLLYLNVSRLFLIRALINHYVDDPYRETLHTTLTFKALIKANKSRSVLEDMEIARQSCILRRN